MKANYKHLVLLAIMLNALNISTTHANEEVDAEFLEFLADMEEATGSGFDAWLNDDSEDQQLSINEIEQSESTELNK